MSRLTISAVRADLGDLGLLGRPRPRRPEDAVEVAALAPRHVLVREPLLGGRQVAVEARRPRRARARRPARRRLGSPPTWDLLSSAHPLSSNTHPLTPTHTVTKQPPDSSTHLSTNSNSTSPTTKLNTNPTKKKTLSCLVSVLLMVLRLDICRDIPSARPCSNIPRLEPRSRCRLRRTLIFSLSIPRWSMAWHGEGCVLTLRTLIASARLRVSVWQRSWKVFRGQESRKTRLDGGRSEPRRSFGSEDCIVGCGR